MHRKIIKLRYLIRKLILNSFLLIKYPIITVTKGSVNALNEINLEFIGASEIKKNITQVNKYKTIAMFG
jgi:hypothetical protein